MLLLKKPLKIWLDKIIIKLICYVAKVEETHFPETKKYGVKAICTEVYNDGKREDAVGKDLRPG